MIASSNNCRYEAYKFRNWAAAEWTEINTMFMTVHDKDNEPVYSPLSPHRDGINTINRDRM